MPGEKEARVVIGVDGAEDVARAGERALAPWRRAGEAVAGSLKRAGSAIASQLGQVGMDMLRTATVMRTLDMRSAVEGARSYREEVTKFGIVAGESTGAMRYALGEISKMTLENEGDLAGWAKGVGRLTYDYVGAVVSAKALHDESIATGKSFDEMGQLGVVMHNALGVTDDMGDALGKIRAQAEALGTVGGVAAFQDQIQALGGAFIGIASHTDEARDRLTGLLGMLGKGYSPAQAQQIQSSVLGQLESRALFISRSLGHDILNEKGEIEDPARVVQELKRHFERVIPDARTRQTALRTYFGNLAGSAVYRGDFSDEAVSQLAGVAPSRRASQAAQRFEESDAGRALKTQQAAQRNLRDTAEALVTMQDKYGEAFADHPMAGQMVSNLLDATMRAATSQLGGLVGGSGGGAGIGGMGAAGGGAGALEGGGAALAGGLGAATLALGVFALAVGGAVKAMAEIGEASAKMHGPPPPLTPEEAKVLREKAKAAEEAAPGERSEGMQHAFMLETERVRPGRAIALLSAYERAYKEQKAPEKFIGSSLLAATQGPNADPVMAELAQELKGGRIDTDRLPKNIADALVDALQRSPLKAVLQAGPGGVAPPDKPQGGRN